MPNSPISLRLTSTSPQFIFFSTALAIYNQVLCTDASELPPNINKEAYNQLRFTFSKTDCSIVSRISLSVTHIEILSTCVAEILNALSGNTVQAFMVICNMELPLLADNWNKKFHDDARKTFEKYQDRFGELPEFERVLTILSPQL